MDLRTQKPYCVSNEKTLALFSVLAEGGIVSSEPSKEAGCHTYNRFKHRSTCNRMRHRMREAVLKASRNIERATTKSLRKPSQSSARNHRRNPSHCLRQSRRRQTSLALKAHRAFNLSKLGAPSCFRALNRSAQADRRANAPATANIENSPIDKNVNVTADWPPVCGKGTGLTKVSK